MPEGWEQKTIGSSGVKVVDGDRGKEYPKSTEFRSSGYCLFLSAKNVTDDGFKFSEAQFISEERHKKLRKGQVLKDSLVLTTRGTVGNFAFFDDSIPYDVIRINSGMVILDAGTSKFKPEFLYAMCRSRLIGKQIERYAFGSAQPQLTVKLINSINVPVPPLPEQTKIAQILSTWDKAIATTEQLLSNSQQQKKALMQQLLTGKKRFEGFEGEWVEVKLDHMATITMGSSPKSEAYNDERKGLPLLQGNADIKNRKSAPRVFTTEITKKCLPGDILLSVRAPVGAVAISEHSACVGRGISAIKANNEILQDYLYQWLLWFESRWVRFSQGSTFESVNRDDIRGLNIRLPGTVVEQQKIASVLSAVDLEIEVLRQELDMLKQEKKVLMQQLLTGKRRVQIENKEGN